MSGSTLTITRGQDSTTRSLARAGVTFRISPTSNQIKQKKLAPRRCATSTTTTTTRYDREFPLFLSENQPESHWRDAHIQITDWAEYNPGFALFNGRAYPDTVAPATDPMYDYVGRRGPGRAGPRAGCATSRSVVAGSTCNAGEIIALRIASLGYIRHTLTIDGVPLHVVGCGRVAAQVARRTSRRQLLRDELGRHRSG